jgi:hypothetical protein
MPIWVSVDDVESVDGDDRFEAIEKLASQAFR